MPFFWSYIPNMVPERLFPERLKKRAKALFVLLALLGAALMPQKALAKYSICNETSYVLEAATGSQENGTLTTQGWFQVLPGQCKVALKGDLEQTNYYLFARTISLYDQILRRFSGGRKLCISTSDFLIKGADKCSDPAQTYEKFIEIKPEKPDWKTALTEEVSYKAPQAAMAGLQRLLAMAGYDIGDIDGIAGGMTNRALEDFMAKADLKNAGKTSPEVFNALISAVRKRQQESGLQICNETRFLVWSSIGQHEGEDILTRGWYKVLPGECIRPLRKPLDGQVIYSYGEAVDDKGQIAVKGGIKLIWAGKYQLCTKKSRFTIETQGKCDGKGLSTTAFRKINLGGAKSWTIRYTEPQ